MHARVTAGRVQPGQLAAVSRRVQEELLPLAKAQPGFRGFVELVDEGSGAFQLLTLWETETAMEAGEAAGYYRSQLGRLEEVLRGLPTRETFAVSLWEIAEGDAAA